MCDAFSGFCQIYPINRFVSVSPCDLCGLCHGVVNPFGARQCFSGHPFCGNCLDQWQKENEKCPIQDCQSLVYFVGSDGSKLGSRVTNGTLEALLKLELKCSLTGCPRTTTIIQMVGHEAECPFKDEDVRAYIQGNLDRIDGLDNLLYRSDSIISTLRTKLSEADSKIINMANLAKEHAVAKNSMIESHVAHITRLRDRIDELEEQLDDASLFPSSEEDDDPDYNNI